jgi:hypothetical protein
MEFEFRLEEIRFENESVTVSGRLSGEITCRFGFQSCVERLPDAVVRLDPSPEPLASLFGKGGARNYSVTDSPAFDEITARQDALLQAKSASASDADKFQERCRMMAEAAPAPATRVPSVVSAGKPRLLTSKKPPVSNLPPMLPNY